MRKKDLFDGFVLTLAGAGCLSFPLSALAQDQSGQDDASRPVVLGSVRVEATALDEGYTSDPASTEGTGSYTTRSMKTATKLPMSIRETPQSVTVITRQRLDDQVMTNITDVVKSTPGLFLSHADGPGRPSFTARGFNIDNIMYDGLPSRYQGWVVGTQANMAIYDRVEVVRGATGLVTGSGNPSAAINLVRKRPTRDFHLNFEASAGSWSNYRGQFDLSGGVGEAGNLRVRAIGSYQDSSTFRDGEVIHRGLLHGIAEYDISPNTVLMAGITHQDDFFNSFWGGLPLSETGQHLGLPRSTRPSFDWEDKTQKSDTVFGELAHNFDNGWSIRLAGMKVWQDALFSGTYVYRRDTDLALTHSTYQASYDENQSTFDIFASGPVKLFGRDHDVTFGASRRETSTRTQNYGGGGILPGSIDMFGFDPASGTRPNFVPTTVSKNVITQSGAYLSARLNPADPLKIILGGRLDWYEYDNRTAATGDYKVDAHKTFYAGAIFDLDRHHSVYASFTDIFQPQTARGFAPDTASQSILAPIVGQNYEAGVKGEYMDGALNAAIAVFRVDQTNRALVPTDQSGCPTFPAASCAVTSGLVRSEGIDIEIQGAITPNWNISAGYTYTKIEFVRDTNPNNGGKNFDTDLPKHMAKVSTFYTLPGDLDRWRVGGTVTWQSGVYNENNGANFRNIPFRVEQGAYAVADLMLGYKFSDEIDVQVNLNNVFDKTYYKAIGYDIRWGSTDAYGEPRNVLATLRGRF